MSRIDYQGNGIKQLACSIILLAIEDYKMGKRRSGNGKIYSAEAFLKGRTPGPGKMTMLEYCCQLADIDQSAIWERVL